MEDISLTFTPSALKELAKIATKRGTGARGLRSVVEHIMLDIMFDAPSKKKASSVRITRDLIQKTYGNIGKSAKGSHKKRKIA